MRRRRSFIKGGGRLNSRYHLSKRLTIKHLLWGGVSLLVVIYLFYAIHLHTQSQDILQQLNNLLS